MSLLYTRVLVGQSLSCDQAALNCNKSERRTVYSNKPPVAGHINGRTCGFDDFIDKCPEQ